ncbi:hypothetical protein AAG570_009239 [Ranatra chinensis]|uniref:Pre-rRNA-processing protein TSR1 homolog n=1 Tax=Ranatra chinensis TaxID=642074 RepID=A0ABD0YTI2_9HEMI
MQIETAHEHRPGPLKQQNKKHKHGRHKSKGTLEKLNKGRVMSILRPHSRKKQELSREEKRNQAAQLRKQKRFEFLQKRRGLCEAPFLTAVVPLHSSISATNSLTKVLEDLGNEAVVTKTSEGQCHVEISRLKHRFTLASTKGDNLFDTLDLLKVADTVIFLTSVNGLDEDAEIMLTTAISQGIPTTVIVCIDLDTVPPKRRQEAKTNIQKDLERWLPEEKVHGLEKNGDGMMLFRRVANQKQRHVIQRDRRPHLLAEHVEFIETSPGNGTLKVIGYLRGQTLSVNSLIHIPGWGDFKMSRIELAPDSFSGDQDQDSFRLLEVADPTKQESLERENIPDPMDAEQTWPTDEEIATAEEDRKSKKGKIVPHGWSDYQAAWIPDEDAIDLDGSDGEELNEDAKMDAKSEGSSDCESDQGDEDEMETGSIMTEVPYESAEKYDKDIDAAEEEATLKKLKEARDDKEFPDEMDTPLDLAARQRFMRYRGLSSFRTSPWDPKENLPLDYARIFQFQNFDRTRKYVLKSIEETSGALAGSYIRIHIADVPTYLYRLREEQPIVVYGMLQHEQKMSVLNMMLKRPVALVSEEAIKSKERLLFQCGYRRFRAQPIFSQHTKGNKFKYERFFQPDSTVVATVYAPIIFPPCSVLVFKENKDGTSSLVATGSLMSVDPNRITLKRVVLSGHMYKVNKRSAVVRFMFFNREDIEWFKPIELHTKYGRRGHIKEPLGTHGHMKCVFNGQLKSQDTVLLNLYKRVFPKWNYDPCVTFSKVEEEGENK